jgi:hypothetical protein
MSLPLGGEMSRRDFYRPRSRVDRIRTMGSTVCLKGGQGDLSRSWWRSSMWQRGRVASGRGAEHDWEADWLRIG